MWIQVRTMDGRTSHRIDCLSKLTKIENLRELLVDKFDIPVNEQRLFYRGKELVNGHSLFDYGVKLNDIIQILRKQPVLTTKKPSETVSDMIPVEYKSSEGGESREKNAATQKNLKPPVEYKSSEGDESSMKKESHEKNEATHKNTPVENKSSEGVESSKKQESNEENKRTYKYFMPPVKSKSSKRSISSKEQGTTLHKYFKPAVENKSSEGGESSKKEGTLYAYFKVNFFELLIHLPIIKVLKVVLFRITNVLFILLTFIFHDVRIRLIQGSRQPQVQKQYDTEMPIADLYSRRPAVEHKSSEGGESSKKQECHEESEPTNKNLKIGDKVYALDTDGGAWWPGKIILISCSKNSMEDARVSSDVPDDKLIYTVCFRSGIKVDLPLNLIRRRASKTIKLSDLEEGEIVMVNYNIDKPDTRGYWYECVVIGKNENRTDSYLLGNINLIRKNGREVLKDCKIKFIHEIFQIEKYKIVTDIQNTNKTLIEEKDAIKTMTEEMDTFETVPEEKDNNKTVTDEKDTNEVTKCAEKIQCKICKDVPSVKCKECNCHTCGGKESPEKQVMCDECDYSFHIWCLKPSLSEVPEGDWYCPSCKNDETEVVRPGEKLKASKKKSKMPSAKSSSSRDWGKGMACVGKSKECTIVPPNHFGPIPGVDVGASWKYRMQLSEAGVHRPSVAGIHGRENEGAYSIVLSGGYEDDKDDGEEFYYTGSGGRDLSGNKRSAQQSCDQTLTRMNKALAVNCKAPFNKDGAEAEEWKLGKPIRVVRNYKGRKHSEYCPQDGNRYDGIYKVVKYWPEKGKSGFVVWRYLLRRDDQSPAPWTEEGKKRIEELGLEMQYPDGSVEERKRKEKDGELSDANEDNPVSKKKKIVYKLPKEADELIKSDVANKKLWEECLIFVEKGQQEFLKKVEDCFQCICCQELVFKPITTQCCFHNICKACLNRSFNAEVFTCPMCRKDLDKNVLDDMNTNLQKALLFLYPGYDVGR